MPSFRCLFYQGRTALERLHVLYYYHLSSFLPDFIVFSSISLASRSLYLTLVYLLSIFVFPYFSMWASSDSTPRKSEGPETEVRGSTVT